MIRLHTNQPSHATAPQNAAAFSHAPAVNLLLIICSLLVAVLHCTPVRGDYTGKQAEASARESLKSRAYPWYDAGSDTGKQPEIEVHAEPSEEALDPGNRKSDWVYVETATSTGPSATMPPWLAALLEVLTWGVLAVVVVGAAVLLWWAFMVTATQSPDRHQAAPATIDRTTDVDRVEELPFNIRPQSDLLAESRRLFEAGDYTQAAVYLYSYKLLMLDRAQHIRLTRGKTNRQYLKELSIQPLRDILQPTMVMFEDAFFGKHGITRKRFESCWDQVQPFENLILSHQSR